MNLFNILGMASLIFGTSGYAQAAPKTDQPAAELVAQLYQDYAWEGATNAREKTEQGLMEQPRKVLARYFDSNLVTLILKDRACVARTQETCGLDYLPIWDSQDPAATDLKVRATNDPSRVRVTFLYPSNGEKIDISYKLRTTRAGWRISDIVGKSGNSLVAQLKHAQRNDQGCLAPLPYRTKPNAT